jgi:hypothetical protein
MRPLRYLSWSYDERGDIFSYNDLSGASRFGHALQQKRVRLAKNRVRVPCIVTDCIASYCAAADTFATPANKTTMRRITTENEAIFTKVKIKRIHVKSAAKYGNGRIDPNRLLE